MVIVSLLCSNTYNYPLDPRPVPDSGTNKFLSMSENLVAQFSASSYNNASMIPQRAQEEMFRYVLGVVPILICFGHTRIPVIVVNLAY